MAHRNGEGDFACLQQMLVQSGLKDFISRIGAVSKLSQLCLNMNFLQNNLPVELSINTNKGKNQYSVTALVGD